MTVETPTIQRSRTGFVQLVMHQTRADLRCFIRNKQSVFFTLALPILFLAIFASVFKQQNVAVPGGRINESVYYVPGIIAYGLIATTFSNLVPSVVHYREAGIYKRRRATPVSAAAVIAGHAVVAGITALALTAVLLAIGWAGFGAHIPGRTGPAFLLAVIVGAVVFSCLGFAVASVVRDGDAAQPVVLAIVLPLCFISGVFISILELPHWLVDVSKVFPVHALAGTRFWVRITHTPLGTGSTGSISRCLPRGAPLALCSQSVTSVGCREAGEDFQPTAGCDRAIFGGRTRRYGHRINDSGLGAGQAGVVVGVSRWVVDRLLADRTSASAGNKALPFQGR